MNLLKSDKRKKDIYGFNETDDQTKKSAENLIYSTYNSQAVINGESALDQLQNDYDSTMRIVNED